MVPRNKQRLFITLFVTGQHPNAPERVFHWTLTTGPKTEDKLSEGYKMHAKNDPISNGQGGLQQVWSFQELKISSLSTAQALVRIRIGKILDLNKVREIAAAVPVIQDNPEWRCRQWVIDAVSALASSTGAVGTSVDLSDWQTIEDTAKRYANGKIEAGRFKSGNPWGMTRLPTLDMMTGEEITP